MEARGERVHDEEEVEGPDGFGQHPRDAAGEVEAGEDAGFAHGLVGGEGGPLDQCELGRRWVIWLVFSWGLSSRGVVRFRSVPVGIT